MDAHESRENLARFSRAVDKIAALTLPELLTTTDPDILAAQAYLLEEISRPEPDHFCTPDGHC